MLLRANSTFHICTGESLSSWAQESRTTGPRGHRRVSIIFPQLEYLCVFSICLFRSQRYRRGDKHPYRERSPMYCFTPQMVAVARAEPSKGRSQKLHSHSPHVRAGAQGYGLSAAAFPGVSPSSCIRSRAAGTQTHPHMECRVTGAALPLRATMLLVSIQKLKKHISFIECPSKELSKW